MGCEALPLCALLPGAQRHSGVAALALRTAPCPPSKAVRPACGRMGSEASKGAMGRPCCGTGALRGRGSRSPAAFRAGSLCRAAPAVQLTSAGEASASLHHHRACPGPCPRVTRSQARLHLWTGASRRTRPVLAAARRPQAQPAWPAAAPAPQSGGSGLPARHSSPAQAIRVNLLARRGEGAQTPGASLQPGPGPAALQASTRQGLDKSAYCMAGAGRAP